MTIISTDRLNDSQKDPKTAEAGQGMTESNHSAKEYKKYVQK